MKNSLKAVTLTAVFTACVTLSPVTAHELDSARPDSHAPVGVTGDHLHQKGEWMFDYRFMYMEMDGLKKGSNDISNEAAFHDQGYTMVPENMTMEMNMFMLMYAPSDSVTLMLMTHYNHSSMSMTMNPHSAMDHDMSHGGHSHAANHSHGTSGWGDTVITPMVKLWENDHQVLHVNLGVGLPTADVEEKQGALYQPYGMQLGNGIWDFRPALTFVNQAASYSWGAQAKARIALEDENDAGFRYGNEYGATAWLAGLVNTALSVSGRISYEKQESISGHYNGPHAHSAPGDFQPNYGGEISEIGLGVNLRIPEGRLEGHRLAMEVTLPIHEDVNGIQLAQDYSFTAGWQFNW
ncbi:transporter [Kiritimatiellaeota bacterium B1221]|nr:transporter [Kiritimatiellaeota bacterium B1221]